MIETIFCFQVGKKGFLYLISLLSTEIQCIITLKTRCKHEFAQKYYVHFLQFSIRKRQETRVFLTVDKKLSFFQDLDIFLLKNHY